MLGSGMVGLFLTDYSDAKSPAALTAGPNDLLFALRTYNGTDLLFYGVNLTLRNGELRPTQSSQDDNPLPSYLIVQLPAQSLHQSALSLGRIPEIQQPAHLSGPSFLVFELWPALSQPLAQTVRRIIRCTLKDILSWDDMTRFRLVASSEPTLAASWPAYSLTTPAGVKSITEHTPDGSYKFYDFAYYRALQAGILWNLPASGIAQLPPVSLLEIPAGMLVSPYFRVAKKLAPGSTSPYMQAFFSNNGNIKQRSTAFAKPPEQEGRPTRQVLRIAYEVWQAELQKGLAKNPWQIQPQDDPALSITSAAPSQPTPEQLTIGLRALGYFDGPDTGRDRHCEPTAVSPDGQFWLPSTEDKRQLLMLNQLASQAGKPGQESDYDIKLPSALVVGGRGASIKMQYSNFRGPEAIDLVEYEHHIQDGQDNFIKVSYIGVLAPSGQKALHTREAQRVIRDGRSYLEYKEYLHVLEPEKSFARKEGVLPGYELFSALDSNNQVQEQPCYGAQLFFSRVEAAFKRSPPINHVGADEQYNFWPRREGATEDSFTNLIKLPFCYFDANGDEIRPLSEHPVQFLRRSFLVADTKCGTTVDGAASNVRRLLKHSSGPSSGYLGWKDDGRFRIPLNGQVVALTEDVPPNKKVSDPAGINKPNRLATDWAEYYYHIKTGPKAFEDPHLIYPQVRHIKAYIDHVQAIAPQQLPSLLEYTPNYLRKKFTDENQELRLMLQHTEAFDSGQMRQLSGNELSPALAPLYPSLKNGMASIRQAFALAGKRLGGMANPDPVLKFVAGHPQNIGLPDLNQLKPIGVQLERLKDPLAILNGDAAEFLGIKIVRLLNSTLKASEVPKFQFNKLIADFDMLRTAMSTLQNQAVSDAINTVSNASQQLSQLEADVHAVQSKWQAVQKQLSVTHSELVQHLPDLEKIRTLGLLYFEQVILKSMMEADASQKQQLLTVELATALEPYVNAWLAVTNVPITYQEAAPALRSRNYWSPTWLAETAMRLEKLSKAIVDTTRNLIVDGSQAQFLLDQYKDQSNNLVKYVADKSKMLESAISSAISQIPKLDSARDVQDQVLAIFLATFKPTADVVNIITSANYLVTQYGQLRDTYLPSKDWDQTIDLVRLVLRLHPQFYQERYDEIARQVTDLRHTSLLLSNLAWGSIEEATTAVQASYLDYANQWANLASINDRAKLLGELRKLRDSYTKSLDTIWQNTLAKLPSGPYRTSIIAYEAARRQLINLNPEVKLREAQVKYQEKAFEMAQDYLKQFENAFYVQLDQLSSSEEIQKAQRAYEQAVHLLRTPLRQELRYDWETASFSAVDLGFVRFIPQTSPRTILRLHTSTTLLFDATKMPAVTTKAVFKTDTEVTDFALSFLGVMRIDFSRMAYRAGSGRSPDFDVRIRAVSFEGALSFIQALQELLSGMVDAFLPILTEKKVTIDYQSPVFGVSTPGFVFANISFGVKVELFFNRQPMLITFRLSEPANKATVVAGIYGGGFYFSLTVSPNLGVVQVAMALEMGALMALNLGPIRGTVRFMAGLYYRKSTQGVLMEGYFIAEGILKVWIISVSARLYMAVRSYGSYVMGTCVVTYKVKVGFLRRSFSARYTKTIAGAPSEREQPSENDTSKLHQAFVSLFLAESLQAQAVVKQTVLARKNEKNKLFNLISLNSPAPTWDEGCQVLSQMEYAQFCLTYF